MSNAARSLGLALGLCILHSLGPIGAPIACAHSKVPARTVNGYLMVVPVRINGQGPFDFVVDTGTNRTLIDPELAEQLGLKAAGRISLATLTDTQPASRYFLGSVTVGSESAANIEALSFAIRPLRAVDKRIRGVLALNFLARFRSSSISSINVSNSTKRENPLPLEATRASRPKSAKAGSSFQLNRRLRQAAGDWRSIREFPDCFFSKTALRRPELEIARTTRRPSP